MLFKEYLITLRGRKVKIYLKNAHEGNFVLVGWLSPYEVNGTITDVNADFLIIDQKKVVKLEDISYIEFK